MWYVWIALLINAMFSRDFVNTYRISLGFGQLGAIEILIMLGLVVGAFSGRGASAAKTIGVHPMMFVILGCFVVGGFMGLLGAVLNEVPMEYSLRHARDYIAWPLCIIAGYRLLPTIQASKSVIYAIVLGGIIVAVLSVMHFTGNVEKVSADNLNPIRMTNYFMAYCGIAALIVSYTIVVRGAKLFPFVLALPIGGICLLGDFATFSRGTWVTLMFCYAVLPLLLPAGQRMRVLAKSAAIGVLLIAGLYASMQVATSIGKVDFVEKVQERFLTILPTARESKKDAKAWDSRVPSMQQELMIWLENPLMGQGFNVQTARVASGRMTNYGAYFHNGWSSVLATTGLFGFVAFWSILGCLVVIGRQLVKHQFSPEAVLFGALCYLSGFYIFCAAMVGAAWTARTALLIGTMCGMMLRLRDIERAAMLEAGLDGVDPSHSLFSETEPELSQGYAEPF